MGELLQRFDCCTREFFGCLEGLLGVFAMNGEREEGERAISPHLALMKSLLLPQLLSNAIPGSLYDPLFDLTVPSHIRWKLWSPGFRKF